MRLRVRESVLLLGLLISSRALANGPLFTNAGGISAPNGAYNIDASGIARFSTITGDGSGLLLGSGMTGLQVVQQVSALQSAYAGTSNTLAQAQAAAQNANAAAANAQAAAASAQNVAANALTTTGDASQTVARPTYSTIGQSSQQRISWHYDLAEDGARGDAASDTAALNRALNYAAAHPGTDIFLPGGTWAFTAPGNSSGFALPSNTTFEGASQSGTVLTWNDQATTGAVVVLFGSGSPQANVVLKNFTVVGSENVVPSGGSTELGQDGHYPILLGGPTNLLIDHVTVQHSRDMSIAIRGATGVTVSNCLIQYSSRDGISTAGSTDVSITDNVLEHVGDDAISTHSSNSDAWGVRRDIVITGNRIFDADGISSSSARSENISGNVIDSVRQTGITVGTAAASNQTGTGIEGVSAPLDVLISNNIVTNVISRQNVDGQSSGSDYIVINGNSARAGSYTGIPGFPGTDGVVHAPYGEMLANSTSTNVPTPGATGVVIIGNLFGRTIPPQDGSVTSGTGTTFSHWSDLGFGTIYEYGNPSINPALAINDLAQNGIHLEGGSLDDILIADNKGNGLSNAVTMDAGGHYGRVFLHHNTFRDMSSHGILLNTAADGLLIADGNLFDLDPFFTSGGRGTHGTWASQAGPAAFYIQSAPNLSVLARNNIVADAVSFANFDTSQPPARWMLRDNVVQADPGAVGFTTTNRGVGQIDAAGGVTVVRTDSDPTSATYGQILQGNGGVTRGMPTTGTYVQGDVLRDVSGGSTAYWIRTTTGSGDTLYADWLPVPALASGNLTLGGNKAVVFQDPTTGKYGYLNMDTTGWLNLFVNAPASGQTADDGLADLRLDQLQLNQKLFLDSSRTMWVQEVSGKVVIGTGSTRLFSIDSSGNVVARGSLTGNGSP